MRDLAVASGSRDRRVAESHLAKPGNASKNGGLRDASSIGAAARVQVIEGLLNQPVEPPRGFVFGDLAIPFSGVKLRVPREMPPSDRARTAGSRLRFLRPCSWTSVYIPWASTPTLPVWANGSRSAARDQGIIHTAGFHRESAASLGVRPS